MQREAANEKRQATQKRKESEQKDLLFERGDREEV